MKEIKFLFRNHLQGYATVGGSGWAGWGGVRWGVNVPWHLQNKNGTQTQTLARTLKTAGVGWNVMFTFPGSRFTKHVLHMASAVGHWHKMPHVNSMADSAGKHAILTKRKVTSTAP